jgi:hypothetical protein
MFNKTKNIYSIINVYSEKIDIFKCNDGLQSRQMQVSELDVAIREDIVASHKYLFINCENSEHKLLYPDKYGDVEKLWLMKYMISKLKDSKIKYNRYNDIKLLEIYSKLYNNEYYGFTDLQDAMREYWHYYVEQHTFTKICVKLNIKWGNTTKMEILKIYNLFQNESDKITIKKTIRYDLSGWFIEPKLNNKIKVEQVEKIYRYFRLIDDKILGDLSMTLICHKIFCDNRCNSYYLLCDFEEILLKKICISMVIPRNSLIDSFVKQYKDYFADCKNIAGLKKHIQASIYRILKIDKTFQIINDSKEICYKPRIMIEKEITNFLKKLTNLNISKIAEEILLNIQKDKPYDENNDALWVDELNEQSPLVLKQITALQNICKHRISIISGGPGTGKTTIIKHLVKFVKRSNAKLVILAPTAKATKIYKSIHENVYTIHKYLYTDDNDVDILVIDETSMVNIELLLSLTKTKKLLYKTHLCFVGDPDQLQPVDGLVLLPELLKIKKITSTILDEIYRTDKLQDVYEDVRKGMIPHNDNFTKMNEKLIIATITEILCKKRESNLIDTELPFLLQAYTNKTVNIFNSKLQRIYLDSISKKTHKEYDDLIIINVKILCACASHNKGSYEIYDSNYLINDENSKDFIDCKKCKEIKNRSDKLIVQEYITFHVYDRVLINNNCYKHNVFNGDEGIIVCIYEDLVCVKLLDTLEDETVYKIFSRNTNCCDLHTLKLAYCRTIHKAQGGQNDNVFIILPDTPIPTIMKNHVYTAVTRAREKIWINRDLDPYLSREYKYYSKLSDYMNTD